MSEGEFDARPRSELGDQAYERIREDILRGVLRPGAEMTEGVLSARYGLGRAPIRSGLLRLRQEGLVTALARRGFLVAPITLRGVQENFVVRAALEPLATRLAVGRVDVEALRACMRAYPLTDDPKVTLDFVRANRQFHVLIAQASGNQKLAQILSKLIDEVDRILHLAQFGAKMTTEERSQRLASIDDHDAIINAIQRGDADAAEAAARFHLEKSRAFVVSTLLEIDGAWAIDTRFQD